MTNSLQEGKVLAKTKEIILREPVFEAVGTRWTWTISQRPQLVGDRDLLTSPVSFPNRESAEEHFRLHELGVLDDSGRRLLSTFELNELLCYAVQMCEGEPFVCVAVPSPRGADGVNWGISWEGADRHCQYLMYNAVAKLRRAYNLREE
jgi:hypothetical protein